MDPEELQRELLETLDAIAIQANAIKTTAATMNVDHVQLRDASGGFAYAPLLGAKAMVLHALAILETEGDLGDGTERKAGSDGSE